MKKRIETLHSAFTGPGTEEARKRLLSASKLCNLLDISPRTLRRWVGAGAFPPPVRVGPRARTLRWNPLDVVAYLRGEDLTSAGQDALDDTLARPGPTPRNEATEVLCIPGVVQHGVVIAADPLPEGARVEIRLPARGAGEGVDQRTEQARGAGKEGMTGTD
jgi:predicted DNA-binding transcriptional regulator AlpA